MIIGVDEAGRGPLAGPVVAAAVVLCDGGMAGLNDSKKLSEKRRIALEAEIKARCHWAIGVADVDEIDRINIFQATMLAMTRAVDVLFAPLPFRGGPGGGACVAGPGSAERPHPNPSPQGEGLMVLVDGNKLPKWRYPSRAIVGGDALEPAISAASIIAKQARDAMMREACAHYPGYGFSQHKGYGTQAHMAALAQLGPCPIHRRSFAPVAQLVLL